MHLPYSLPDDIIGSAPGKGQVGLLSSDCRMGGAQGWKRFMPVEATPIIACMVAVGALATYRLIVASNLHDVRFTRSGGENDWTEKLEEIEKQRKEKT